MAGDNLETGEEREILSKKGAQSPQSIFILAKFSSQVWRSPWHHGISPLLN